MFEFVPRPKTEAGRGFVVITGIVALLAGLYYLLSTVDFIPDGVGPFGYIDDLIMIIIIWVLAKNLIHSVVSRGKAVKTAAHEFFQAHTFWDLMKSHRFLSTVLIVAACLAYFAYAWDIIGDYMVGVGYIDDIIFALGGLMTILNLYKKRRQGG